MSENRVSGEMVCWKCGAVLEDLILPMSRREECRLCAADQHVCMLCRSYSAQVAGQCREERAEEVTDKERANFCDYFEPKLGAYQEKGSGSDKEARGQLAELFGDDVSHEVSEPISDEDKARAELEKLFGGDAQE